MITTAVPVLEISDIQSIADRSVDAVIDRRGISSVDVEREKKIHQIVRRAVHTTDQAK